jgi:hypothetical protein
MGIGRQPREELADLCLSHLCGVALSVEEDEPFDPVDVCLFRLIAVMADPNGLVDLIKELGLWRTRKRGDLEGWRANLIYRFGAVITEVFYFGKFHGDLLY